MELFIEKYRVDVNKTFSTLLTLAIDDIKDFGSKNTTFSKTIILPGTNNNNKLFGSIFETTARQDYNPLQPNVGLNFNAATSARALIFVDNIQVFKGTLRLLEIINDNGFIEYECAVFGELGGLVASIGNAKLEDLDFSAYNHTYNLTNIVASWDNASAGVGYYYPLIDYGTYSTAKKDWNYRTFRPTFFVKEYIDKIFANAGYTFDSTHLNTTRVKSWIIPHNRKTLTSVTTLAMDRQVSPPQDITDPVGSFGLIYGIIDFNVGLLGSFSNPIIGQYKYNGASINSRLIINITNITGVIYNLQFALFKNGVIYDLVTMSSPITDYVFDQPFNFNTNDIIYLEISGNGISGGTFTCQGNIKVTSIGSLPVPLDIGGSFIANDSLPQNILQKDFLSSILKLSNLYVFESALSFDVSRVPDTAFVLSIADNVAYKQTFATLTTLGDFTPSGSNTIFTYTGAAKVANFKVTLNLDYDNSTGIVEFTTILFHVGLNTFTLANIYSTDPLTGNISFTANPSYTINTNDQVYATVRSDDSVNPTSAIQLKFNIFKIEDADNDKLLKIEPFIDFYANAQSEDWSLKLDRSKTQRSKPMSELNSRYYEFNYKDDSDYYNDLYKKRYNQGYGSYKYDSQFEFSKESTKVDIIFSGTPLVGYTGEDKVYSTIFKKSNNNEETVDSNIRILQAKKITGVSNWHIIDAGGGSLHNSTVYPYAGHLDDPDAPNNDLNFGVPKELFFTLVTGALNVNQFNVYWSSYMAEITDKDSRLLTAYFKLDFKDIHNIDFSKLKWIDGVLYRLNKIEDFNVTDPDVCKCELLKVINKIY